MFNQRNAIICFTTIVFIIYLTIPPPIILIETDKNPTCCHNCTKSN